MFEANATLFPSSAGSRSDPGRVFIQHEDIPMLRILTFLLALCLLATATLAQTEDNSTPNISKPVQDQPRPAQTPEAAPPSGVIGKFPLDIQARGSDQSGTLLSYKLKEEVMASRLFELTASEKKKFVLHVISQPEFPDRPELASIYSIVLVYQEDAGALTYYLNQYQGQVHPEAVPAEMRKILEWTYSNLKRFNYLLEE
jgi:hypothetical protein